MNWATHQFRAMGSQIQLWLDAGQESAQPAFERVQAWFAEAETGLSRFRDGSDLSRLNRSPEQWVLVSPLLWRVVTTALSLARATRGLFDPTILPALEAAGYMVSFEQMPNSRAAPLAVLPAPGRWQDVRLDGGGRAIWLPAGVRLDLGGVAKGIVAQDAVQMLSAVGPALVDAGGDLTAGLAPRGWPGWPVSVAAPSGKGEAERDLFRLWLAGATLATSGSDYRRWRQGTQLAHHLIDPRTGSPASSDVLSASILAPGAADAEGWATAALIAGSALALDMLAERKLPAALVCAGGRVRLTTEMTERQIG